MTGALDQLSASEKGQLVAIANAQAFDLVPDAGSIDYVVRDQHFDAAAKADIAANQLHLKIGEDEQRDVVLRNVEGLLGGINLKEEGEGRKFYFPGDPASKRVLMKKLRDGGDLKGLAVAQKWIEGAGLSNISQLFQLEANDVRKRLYADPQVQAAITLEPNRLQKVRAMGSGVHTAAEKAVAMLETRGYAIHDLNTDDVCPDWPGATEAIRQHLRQRAPKENMYFTAMLLSPEEAKQEAANHPDITLSPDAVAQKARTFATTLKEILGPQYPNILLVDKDLNVVMHRENGKDIAFDEAAYGKYLKSCGIDMSGRGESGQGRQASR